VAYLFHNESKFFYYRLKTHSWIIMIDRRKFISAVAGAGAVGIAGCSGNTGNGSDGGDSNGGDGGGDASAGWPPSRNTVDMQVDTDPGGLIDILARIWFNYMDDQGAYPGGDITTTVTNRPGAQGNVMMNDLYNNAPTDGGQLGAMRVNSAIVNQIGASQAEFDLSEMRAVVRFSADTRALQFNPRTTPVEDHWELTWEDFRNLAEERTLRFPVSNSAQLVFASYLRANDPVLNEDNWEFVQVSGGSAARAAIQRGDADGYFGSYVSNISTRNDSYYTQFVMVNPEVTPDFFEQIADVLPETSPTASREAKILRENQEGIIMNTPFPEDAAATVSQIVNDHHMGWLPPETPDEIYDIHEEAFSTAADAQEVADNVAETFSAPDHNPLAGQRVQDIADNKFQTLAEDDEVRTLIEEELF
jgi:tripartite-type tricarboxylate transporter receptor subunit TctC